jgi:hypothetical protein
MLTKELTTSCTEKNNSCSHHSLQLMATKHACIATSTQQTENIQSACISKAERHGETGHREESTHFINEKDQVVLRVMIHHCIGSYYLQFFLVRQGCITWQ